MFGRLANRPRRPVNQVEILGEDPTLSRAQQNLVPADGLTFLVGASGSSIVGLAIDGFTGDGILIDHPNSINVGSVSRPARGRAGPAPAGGRSGRPRSGSLEVVA